MSEPFSLISMPHWPPAFGAALPAGQHAFARMESLLEKLGNPEQNLPPVLHVAGTNGKGSVIAFLYAMLKAAGVKTHVYTNPHLKDFEERITLSNSRIAPEALHAQLEACRLAQENAPISFFEGTTCAALRAFAQTAADILLVETGMGGSDDPTNIIPHKALTIITPISYDHTEYLGKTLKDIARHKAGIMRAGTPCVVMPQEPEVLQVLREEAQAIGAPLYVFGEQWAAEKHEDGQLYFEDTHGGVLLPAPNLLGEHQYINAAAAIAALSLLPVELPAGAVEQGVTQAVWPGRLQQMQKLPNGHELWMDGGHNLGGAQAIAQHMTTYWQDKPTHLIFGTTQGKDAAPIFDVLLPKVVSAYAVPVRAEPKSYTALALQQYDSSKRLIAQDSVQEAIETITTKASEPARILVFGSLYFYAELMA